MRKLKLPKLVGDSELFYRTISPLPRDYGSRTKVGPAHCKSNRRTAFKIMLIGEYTHTQDDKKRISLPSKFRKEMGKKVVVTRGLDNCLFMYTVKEWAKISEKLGGLSIGQADSRGFNRIFLGGAQEIDIDSIGRILLPEFQREYAGIESKNKVVFAGVHSRVEIWEESRWRDYSSKILKQADQLAEKLGEIGAI